MTSDTKTGGPVQDNFSAAVSTEQDKIKRTPEPSGPGVRKSILLLGNPPRESGHPAKLSTRQSSRRRSCWL